MEVTTKQSKTRVNARAAKAEAGHKLPTSLVPGQGIDNVGGPTSFNYKSTDDSAKQNASVGVKKQSRTKVNAGAKAADSGKKLTTDIIWGEDVELDDEDSLEEGKKQKLTKKIVWEDTEDGEEYEEIIEAKDEDEDDEEEDDDKDDEEDDDKDDEEKTSEKEAKKLSKKVSKKMQEENYEFNFQEDISALIGNEDLSEEFCSKAALIFESAVRSKLQEEIEKMEIAYAEEVVEELNVYKQSLAEKVDTFLNYVCNEWLEENEIAIEHGLKLEIAESFMAGIKDVFEENYVEMPDEKYNILEEMAEKLDEMEEKLNEQIEKNIDLSEQISFYEKQRMIHEASLGLVQSQAEKFISLAESIEYNNEDEFVEKLETIKESYFPKRQVRLVEDNFESTQEQLNESMSAYVNAISRWSK